MNEGIYKFIHEGGANEVKMFHHKREVWHNLSDTSISNFGWEKFRNWLILFNNILFFTSDMETMVKAHKGVLMNAQFKRINTAVKVTIQYR